MHILQVEHGCPPGAETDPDPRYDPATTSLLDRVAVKVQELAGTDLATSDRPLPQSCDTGPTNRPTDFADALPGGCGHVRISAL